MVVRVFKQTFGQTMSVSSLPYALSFQTNILRRQTVSVSSSSLCSDIKILVIPGNDYLKCR